MAEQEKLPPLDVRERCREILLEEAKRHEIEPAYIVAHVRYIPANHARKVVQRRMIEELGIKRHVIATMFGRDLRRVRASVLSKTPALRRRKPIPAVPVGNQFVWEFAVVTDAEKQGRKTLRSFMRPLPAEMAKTLSGQDRVRLIQFYQDQARALRGVNS